MSGRTKQPRLGPQLGRALERPGFFSQVHVIFGGTGAVGGATALQLISIFEEARRWRPATEDRPTIVCTGRTRSEVKSFTQRLFAIHQRDHGVPPTHLPAQGYRTAGGVNVELTTLAVDPVIPELAGFERLAPAARTAALATFLDRAGLSNDAAPAARLEALRHAVAARVGKPFSGFVADYRQRQGMRGRLRSVIVSIPLASVATYKLGDLEAAYGALIPGGSVADLDALKAAYLEALGDDLGLIRRELAEEVLIAHTTAVGGMYDEDEDGRRSIRLGFSHSAIGQLLLMKQRFAEQLTTLYAERDIKMLITAAAIGIDEIRVGRALVPNGKIRALTDEALAAGHTVIPEGDRNIVHVYPPRDLPLLGAPHAALAFTHGAPLALDYAIRSGENGMFSIANADALYRVMRVTLSSELGLTLARAALLGDDPGCPRFPGNICYYTETDNSRQLFDLLSQPRLLANQLSGLQPKALQDLGSAKHQAELHALGLLILLQRLKSLDLDALPARGNHQGFDPHEFFEAHSQKPTLDRVVSMPVEELARDLVILATASRDSDLHALRAGFRADPQRQEGLQRVFKAVLRAAWAIPSLGTPIVYERDGRTRVVLAHYVAPIDQVVTHEDSLELALRRMFERSGGGDEQRFARFVDFIIAAYGFLDLRAAATLVTARSHGENLEGRVQRFTTRDELLAAIAALPPYSYFATSGVLALHARLGHAWRQARELDLELGTANEFRCHFPTDERGQVVLVPGVLEAFRMVAEGLEKSTGSERLDGQWGYGRAPGQGMGS